MKLKSFSFLEVIASIIISGLVISSAYSILIYTHQQFFKFTNVKTEIRNYFELSSTLNREFETAKKIIQLSHQEIELQFTDKKINYSFNNDYILRTLNYQTDTFFFPVSAIEINVINELSEELLIDYVNLSTVDNGGNKSLSLSKNYGAIIKIED